MVALQDQLLGGSVAMNELRTRVAEAAEVDVPLLIEGERGTGRERLARLLHEFGPRKHGGFVRVDPDDLDERETTQARIDAELRRAEGGTLLVKEIVHCAGGPQRRLLKAIKRCRGVATSGDVDVRIVASTALDLERAVSCQLFDAELYERLGGLRLLVPALRRRAEDIPLLVDHFASRMGRELGVERLGFATGAIEKLRAYSWPGNIAELRDVVRRLCLRCRRGRVERPDVDAVLPSVSERLPLEQLSFEEMVRAKIRGLLERMDGYPIEDLYDEVLARVERPLIELVLERTSYNQLKAAEILGLNRNTLRKKIVERKLTLPADSSPAPRRKRR